LVKLLIILHRKFMMKKVTLPRLKLKLKKSWTKN